MRVPLSLYGALTHYWTRESEEAMFFSIIVQNVFSFSNNINILKKKMFLIKLPSQDMMLRVREKGGRGLGVLGNIIKIINVNFHDDLFFVCSGT